MVRGTTVQRYRGVDVQRYRGAVLAAEDVQWCRMVQRGWEVQRCRGCSAGADGQRNRGAGVQECRGARCRGAPGVVQGCRGAEVQRYSGSVFSASTGVQQVCRCRGGAVEQWFGAVAGAIDMRPLRLTLLYHAYISRPTIPFFVMSLVYPQNLAVPWSMLPVPAAHTILYQQLSPARKMSRLPPRRR